MNENIDLIQILKDAPKGTMLWSPIYGDCEFMEIQDDNDGYPIVMHTACDDYAFFSAKGEYCIDYDNTECILFPSRTNRDWSTFKIPPKDHKEFKPFEKVLRVDDCALASPDPWIKVWSCDFYSFYDKNTRTHYCASGYVAKDDEIIPYIGNEDMLGKKVEIKD